MSMQKPNSDVSRLVDIMTTLLSPQGCPWDREQTLESLRPYVIEEAFEVVDAIDSGNPESIKEELGDLLLQIVFQSELTKQNEWFGFQEIVNGICDKLIRRHPGVFGEDTAENSEQALENWEAIKAKEKEGRGVLDGVPKALPALIRAVRVGEKASSIGFDFPDVSSIRLKIDEELHELDEAIAGGNTSAIEDELGDLLFAISNFARKKKLDPEACLRGTLHRFTKRFEFMEKSAQEDQMTLSEMSLNEKEALWDAAKEQESHDS